MCKKADKPVKIVKCEWQELYKVFTTWLVYVHRVTDRLWQQEGFMACGRGRVGSPCFMVWNVTWWVFIMVWFTLTQGILGVLPTLPSRTTLLHPAQCQDIYLFEVSSRSESFVIFSLCWPNISFFFCFH